MRNNLYAVFSMLLFFISTSQAQQWKIVEGNIMTRFAKQVKSDNALPEYPRPQMVRPQWQNLNGLWDCTVTKKDTTMPQKFDKKILVPYPVESALSGIKQALRPDQRLWYKRNISKPKFLNNKRFLLHFGAVDYKATIYINGKQIGEHVGGYNPFSFDITDELKNNDNELVVSVWDPTESDIIARGKQILTPVSAWYTATSGIWQTVWLEEVPAVYIQHIQLIPNVDSSFLSVKIDLNNQSKNVQVEIKALEGTKLVSKTSGLASSLIKLPVENAHLWSTTDPFLYDLKISISKNGKNLDEVSSYFGMRKISVKKDSKGFDRICLNDKPVFNLGVLDQGFWPEGAYTAPTDSALWYDIDLMKQMGFTCIRKHIKVEPARWYYHCDRLGMMVWQDMPCRLFNMRIDKPEQKIQFEKEVKATIEQCKNYPSIIMWVLYNEDWGAYDQERLTKELKTADPSRLINGHSGPSIRNWPSSDIADIHFYCYPSVFPKNESGKASVIGEFGGVNVVCKGHEWKPGEDWGHGKIHIWDIEYLYESMVDMLKRNAKEGLCGAIYTEPYDVEIEQNGLQSYDRAVIKIPVKRMNEINQELHKTYEEIAK